MDATALSNRKRIRLCLNCTIDQVRRVRLLSDRRLDLGNDKLLEPAVNIRFRYVVVVDTRVGYP